MKSLSELINTFHLTVDAEKENVDSKSKIWEHINAQKHHLPFCFQSEDPSLEYLGTKND